MSKIFESKNDVAVRFLPYGSDLAAAVAVVLCVQWVRDGTSVGARVFRRQIRRQRRRLRRTRRQRGNLLFCPFSPQFHLPHRQWRLVHSVILKNLCLIFCFNYVNFVEIWCENVCLWVWCELKFRGLRLLSIWSMSNTIMTESRFWRIKMNIRILALSQNFISVNLTVNLYVFSY